MKSEHGFNVEYLAFDTMSNPSAASITLGVPEAQLESSATFENHDEIVEDPIRENTVPVPISDTGNAPSSRKSNSNHPGRILGKQSKVFGGVDEARGRLWDWVFYTSGFIVLLGISIPPFVIRHALPVLLCSYNALSRASCPGCGLYRPG